MAKTPLFPLNLVLFPGSRVALQLFEQRYLDMIKSCFKDDTGFVIVLIKSGNEAGATPEIFSTGCYARVVDWTQLDNGLLGLTVEGQYRVNISDLEVMPDNLLVGSVEQLSEPEMPVPQSTRQPLVDLLKTLISHPAVDARHFEAELVSAQSDDQPMEITGLLWALASLLPFSSQDKQAFLELSTPTERLALLEELLSQLQG